MSKMFAAMDKVVVQHSPIHGRGVFAARRIAPGEVVIDGCREVLSDDAIASLPTEERIFLSVMDGQNILMKPPARFVNHSCDPNGRATDRDDVAVRAIEPGEEVTVDYVAEHVPGLRLECKPGAELSPVAHRSTCVSGMTPTTGR